jgi:hypothetical protein
LVRSSRDLPSDDAFPLANKHPLLCRKYVDEDYYLKAAATQPTFEEHELTAIQPPSLALSDFKTICFRQSSIQ